MLRSLASRSRGAGTRALSTSTPAAPPSSAPTPPPPPPPPPPAPPRPGLLRRVTPAALAAGAGFFAYRVVTDNEFRQSLEAAVPAAAPLLSYVPSTDPAPVATEASAAVDASAERASNLPPGYDTVPNLLRKIEETKSGLPAAADAPSGSPPQKANIDITSMTPTERAAAKVAAAREADSAAALHSAKGPVREASAATKGQPPKKGEPVKNPAPTAEKPAAPVPAGAAVAKPVIAEPAPPAKADKPGEKKPSLSERMAAESDVEGNKSDASAKASATGSPASGKEKLARILGKGDFQTDKVDGPDVVDDSEYKKPKPWSSSSSSAGPSSGRSQWKRRGPSSWKPTGAPAKSAVAGKSDAADAEVAALRSELESQLKWEAVRLQEAVRAQLVEDKKIAAREAAAIAQRHVEELARVREDAIAQAQKTLEERTREMKTRTGAERDADVLRLLKVKEEELRDSLADEYAERERASSLEREKTLLGVKAQIGALTDQFDAVVMQTEKAKDAAKRANKAFLLHQTVSAYRPIGKQLSEAGGETELGQLVVSSVPEEALSRGVQTLDMLQSGFQSASRKGLSVAMVPEGKTGTLWGHFLGTIFSRLKIPVDSRDDDANAVPTSNEERIRLAGRLVDEGDIGAAITTLGQLKGLSADIMSDWLGAAKARVAADLAAEVLLADAIIAQVALTGSAVKGDNIVVV